MAVITRPYDDPTPIAPTVSAEGGKPDNIPTGNMASQPAQPTTDYGEDIDLGYWIQCMDDAERTEQDWRKRGRQVVEIYRNDTSAGKGRVKTTETTFNILYANTEVLLGAVYTKPPEPVVRSRFASAKPVPMLPQPPPMPMMPGGGMLGPPAPNPPGMPPDIGASPMPIPAGAAALPPPLPGVAEAAPGGQGLPPPAAMAGPGLAPADFGLPPEVAMAMAGPGSLPVVPRGLPPSPDMAGPAVPPGMPQPLAGAPGGLQTLNPSATPPQKDIETAAAIIEKALEIVVDDEHSHEAIKTAIKDVLLPGRGVCRVRWKPQMETVALPGGPLPDGTAPTQERKVWEEIDDEYVFWEDFLCDPVRQAKDCDWVAFRHLFTESALKAEFAGNPKFDALVAANKVGDLLVWTDETAAKHMVGGGSAPKTAGKLGNHRRKAMVWEIWDRLTRKIIWLIRDGAGLVLRADPDSMQLNGFYPVPVPMLAVTTSDSRIPKTYFDLYAKLATDLDVISDRIAKLQDKIKIRGAYNSASKDISDLLTAADGKMLPVAGVDMLNGGLQNHIWLLPIADWIVALQQLYVAQDEIKNSIYEIMGISDIMRGATKATETATAQRIKGSMGVSRLEDMKGIAGNFVRDMIRLKAEVICKNFDASTLSKMTGEEVTPAVEAILRSDFQRTCSVDIETDSTVQVDEAAEQQSVSMVFMAIGTIMTGAQQMLAGGLLPAPMILQFSLELIKMALHAVRYSRPVVELINTYQEQLEQMIAVGAQFGPPPAPPGSVPAGPGGPSPAARPGGGGPPVGPRPGGGPPPKPNGVAGIGKPPIAGTPPSPEIRM
jgi:hypothetical protein